MSDRLRIAINTGGGDAPGLNAVIFAVTLAAHRRGWEVHGIQTGYAGLLDTSKIVPLTPDRVAGIVAHGGTILGTTNRGDPFKLPLRNASGAIEYRDDSDRLVENFRRLGFDVLVVEVMGRYAGWIALHSGASGSADAILIPEIPFDIEKVCQRLAENERRGKRYGIVVVAEGAKPVGGEMVTRAHDAVGREEVLLGGIAEQVAHEIARRTGKETRALVLGHLQRGGSPTTFDRLLALRFGAAAVRFISEGKRNVMVAFHPPEMRAVPIPDVISKTKRVPLDSDTILTCRDLGLSFGD